MVDAVSLSGNSYRAASSALASRIAESRPAAEALAVLSGPQPVTTVSAPSDAAEEIGDLAFLYAPNGQPGLATQPVSATQSTPDTRVAAERNPSARLAIESTDLDALMSSFLTARTPSANPAPSPDVPAPASNEQLALAARQSVINQLYNQF